LLLAAIFFPLLIGVFRFPFWGSLMWFWVSIMAPHRLAYGPMSVLPIAMIVAGVTLPVWFLSREPKLPPWDRTTILICCLFLWSTVTSFFALAPSDAVWERWELFAKTVLFLLITYAMLNSKARIDQLIAVCTLSVAFYGFRGGVFTILHGGSSRIYGPDDSMIGDNNELGVAFCMYLPLLFYMYQRYSQKYIKLALFGLIVCTGIASLFTYSRGALLAISAMGFMIWLRSTRKLLIGCVIALAVVGVWNFAPPQWFDRMSTIETYEKDQSATSRLDYWHIAWVMATRRPLLGGGYRWNFYPEIANAATAGGGAPPLPKARAIHSIWFETLGEFGFPGLFVFVGIFLSVVIDARWLVRNTRGIPELAWANYLGRMLVASLVGFAVGGTFASLEIFDGFYILIIVAGAARRIVAQELGKQAVSNANSEAARSPVIRSRRAKRPVLQTKAHLVGVSALGTRHPSGRPGWDAGTLDDGSRS
jgi:putative inorganic carbon (hco3(-)) transporter